MKKESVSRRMSWVTGLSAARTIIAGASRPAAIYMGAHVYKELIKIDREMADLWEEWLDPNTIQYERDRLWVRLMKLANEQDLANLTLGDAQ